MGAPGAGEDVAAAPSVRPDAEFERLWLDDTSWVDVARGWLTGADDVHEALVAGVRWQQGRLWRYERWVDEPRLGASWRPGRDPAHPVLLEAHRRLRHRYEPFEGFALAWYRDGRDSVAFHRDRELRWLDDTVIAVLTVGARRPWLLRPRANRYVHDETGGATHDLQPGAGDLIVMGGRCQADWEHAVPKVSSPIADRVSLQWRWTSRTGRPERGASYRAPRTFSR
jgi:alkylated DNA repair dioxygenase AlkB